MDPTACLKLIIDAIEANDNEAIQEHISNLMEWMRKGGFVPTIGCSELEILLQTIATQMPVAV